VARRVLRSNHDRHRVNQQNIYRGILQNHVAANTRGLALQNVPTLARQSSLEITWPPPPWLATDTHRSRTSAIFASLASANVQIPIDPRLC
jgi:hypothetical protein